MKRIKAILIDLDDTLYEYGECNKAGMEAALKELARMHGMDVGGLVERFDLARKNVKERLGKTAASHSRLLYFKGLTESIWGRTEPEKVMELERLFWEKYFKRMEPYEGARALLENAKKIGLKVGIITNLTTGVQLRKLVKLGLHRHIDHVITSEEVGVEKPHPKIFSHALAMMKLKSDEVVMIGDSREDDVEGAQKAGIRAIHVERGFFSKKDNATKLLKNIEIGRRYLSRSKRFEK